MDGRAGEEGLTSACIDPATFILTLPASLHQARISTLTRQVTPASEEIPPGQPKVAPKPLPADAASRRYTVVKQDLPERIRPRAPTAPYVYMHACRLALFQLVITGPKSIPQKSFAKRERPLRCTTQSLRPKMFNPLPETKRWINSCLCCRSISKVCSFRPSDKV